MLYIRIIIFVLTLCAANMVAHAQVRIGFNGGVVLSTLNRDSNIAANDGSVGYLVGANVKYNLGELGWYLQSGVDFTSEGDYVQPLKFLKIPLIIGLDAKDHVSIFVAYNLAWQTGNANGVQEFYNNFANMLGLGFEIHMSPKVSVGARLNYGLSNLVSVPAEAKNFTVKPLTFDLYLAFRLN